MGHRAASPLFHRQQRLVPIQRLALGLRIEHVVGHTSQPRAPASRFLRSAQKARFGGEFLTNVTEAASGQQFAEFFQTSRDGTTKGILVIDPTKETWT